MIWSITNYWSGLKSDIVGDKRKITSAAQFNRYAANLVSRSPMSAVDVTLKVLGYALFPYSGIIEMLTDGLTRSAQQTNDVAASGDIEKMEAVERRQELEMRMAERQAKVAQELAIQKIFYRIG